MIKQSLNDVINKALNANPEIRRMLQNIGGRSPAYRYYTRTGSQDRYFYTTKKINHKEKPRYVAGIYRYLKTRKAFKLIKSVGFAKKYKAITWAEKAKNKEESLKSK